jgi:Cu2+-exporting ATPase
VVLATTITARRGIFIRNRSAFEMSRKLNAIVFDKTGTLTEGKFGVTDVVSFITNQYYAQLLPHEKVDRVNEIKKEVFTELYR